MEVGFARLPEVLAATALGPALVRVVLLHRLDEGGRPRPRSFW